MPSSSTETLRAESLFIRDDTGATAYIGGPHSLTDAATEAARYPDTCPARVDFTASPAGAALSGPSGQVAAILERLAVPSE